MSVYVSPAQHPYSFGAVLSGHSAAGSYVLSSVFWTAGLMLFLCSITYAVVNAVAMAVNMHAINILYFIISLFILPLFGYFNRIYVCATDIF